MSRDGKKRLPWLLVSAVVIVIIGGVVLWLTREPANRLVTVSPETTVLTGPLNPDGTVNYVAAINEIYSKGVTKDNNAAVLLVRVIGPEMFYNETRSRTLQLLEIGHLPTNGDYFVPLGKYVEANPPPATPGLDPEEYTREELEKVMVLPWSPREFPLLAGWLKANEKPLALLIEASKRPRYFVPSISQSDPPAMIDVMLPFLGAYRRCTKALAARAMLKCSRGDADSAWQDILAAHRLARLVCQGPTIVDCLVGVAMEAIACRATRALAGSGKMTAAQARQILADLQGLTPLPHPVETIDKCERFMLLDIISRCSSQGTRRALGGSGFHAASNVPNVNADWDEVLREANRWFDRQVGAMRLPSFTAREAAFESYSNDFQSHFVSGSGSWFSSLLFDIKDYLGIDTSGSEFATALRKDPGKAIIGMFMSSLGRCSVLYDRVAIQQQLTQVAVALTAYRAERGEYPAELSQISPGYLKKIPNDLFVEKPLQYRRAGAGYILYSVGENMIDDGGKTSQDDSNADDIVVEVK